MVDAAHALCQRCFGIAFRGGDDADVQRLEACQFRGRQAAEAADGVVGGATKGVGRALVGEDEAVDRLALPLQHHDLEVPAFGGGAR
jgi:hypothetical protein